MVHLKVYKAIVKSFTMWKIQNLSGQNFNTRNVYKPSSGKNKPTLFRCSFYQSDGDC